MKKVIAHEFLKDEAILWDFILNFECKGEPYGNQNRNSLRLFGFNDMVLNVKSFKVPNIVNQVVYSFFRKSKAHRSYDHANKLLSLGIGTPRPVAYYEFRSGFMFRKSYYLSEQLDYDYTYRDLITDFKIPNYEQILREFTRFTYKLHENNILFKDHSPGNTLIEKNGDSYNFYLVDLNRMEFKSLTFYERVKNFSRITPRKEMVEVMSDEYAKLTGEDYQKIVTLMWKLVSKFQHKFYLKIWWKNKFMFWRKKR
jgi:hypothetical protein